MRDFAWVSSKTYVWDAAGYRYRPGQAPIELHSLYPRDAMPLWDKVSTKAIAQTMKTLWRGWRSSTRTRRPSNVHGPVFGMEYPMIAFCGARPQPDGSYTPQLEYALISRHDPRGGPQLVPDDRGVSDERKWTWMDEGLNSFLAVLRGAGLGPGLAAAGTAWPGEEHRELHEGPSSRCRS